MLSFIVGSWLLSTAYLIIVDQLTKEPDTKQPDSQQEHSSEEEPKR